MTAEKEQHSEKKSLVDANSKQNAVLRNVSETSPGPCRLRVGINHGYMSFIKVMLFAFLA